MAVFEGSEKRIEVCFAPENGLSGPNKHPEGLRRLTRQQLDTLLDYAACKIISARCTDFFDAYVLSESSLFVYDTRYILKTCGTTKLLKSIPELLIMAGELGLHPVYVRFSRASFLFPEKQPAPHTSFTEEVAILKSYFGEIASACNAYVLGDQCQGLQWHFFVAGTPPITQCDASLEVCMTGLSRKEAAAFFKDDAFVSAWQTTCDSGIVDLLPGADVDDVVFWPCGYSMNGLVGEGYLTIHVTPEEECSYASVEFTGFPPGKLPLDRVMNQVAKIFKPDNLYITATLTKDPGTSFIDEDCIMLGEYWCRGMSVQKCPGGLQVAFGSFGVKATLGSSGRLGSAESMSCSEVSEEESEPRVKAIVEGTVEQKQQSILEALRGAYRVDQVSSSAVESIDAYARSIVEQRVMEDTFYVLDLSVVRKLHALWTQLMPRVHPYYAVKCNPDPGMISLLSILGAGFDCASEEEVRLVLGLGVPPSKILFANACKRPRDIRTARALGISLMTFDTRAELEKLHRQHPGCQLLLRIRADDPNARCQLGNKYGAEVDEVPSLLRAAKQLDLNVIGISFHVGSGAENPEAFTNAIRLARLSFEQGAAMGFDMRILDIGGGFRGGQVDEVDLGGVPNAVNRALDAYFPRSSGTSVIAEPGRYFAEAAATLMTFVYGRRERADEEGKPMLDYWITDGLYGSFNCIPYDHATVVPRAVKVQKQHQQQRVCSEPGLFLTTLFGPSCDGLDTVVRDVLMPELEMGDWVAFSNMGAYTIAGASNFNGFNATDVDVFYVWAE